MKKRVIFWFLTALAAFALLFGLVDPSSRDVAGSGVARRGRVHPPSVPLDRTPGTAEALSLTGRVWSSRGKPVAAAEIRLTVARSQDELWQRPCLREHPAIARCPCPEATSDIVRWIESDALDWPAPREVVLSDDEGFFQLTLPDAEAVVFVEALSAESERATLRLDAQSLRQPHADPKTPLHIHLGPATAITGRVSDASGRPIEEATVAALSLHTPRARLVQTDAQGRFAFDDLDAAPHRLVATSPGYLAASARFSPAHESGDLALVLQAPCAIDGQLSTPQGQPAGGARIRLSGVDGWQQAIAASSQGRFAFEGLVPGRYDLLATLGNASAQMAVRCSADDAPPSTVSLRLVEGLCVSGVVREALTGQPIAQAQVRALFLEAPGAEGQSDETGAFELLGVPRGSAVIASAEGFQAKTMPLPFDGTDGVEELVFELRQRQSVSGQIVRHDGQPVPGVQVVLSRGHAMTSTFSDDSGRFRLDVESPGLVTIEAHHSALGGAAVSTEAPADDVVLRLAPGAQIAATAVSEASGQPLAGARLRAEPATASARQTGQAFFSDFPSGKDGALSLSGLTAGVYDVIASAPGFVETRLGDVPLTEGEQLDLGRVELTVGATLEGLVRLPSGQPASGARVTAHQPRPVRALSDATGHFALQGLSTEGESATFELSATLGDAFASRWMSATDGFAELELDAREHLVRGRLLDARQRPVPRFSVNGHLFSAQDGTFELTLDPIARQAAETGGLFLTVRAPDEATLTRDVTLSGGDATDLGDLVLSRTGSVHGHVLDARRQPVPGAQVTLSGLSSTDSSLTTSRADGAFTLTGVPSGERVYLSACAHSLCGDDVAVTMPIEGDLSADITLHLPSQAAVEGQVRDRRGQPIVGARLSVSGDPATETFSDARGHYRIPAIALWEGRAEVTVSCRAERAMGRAIAETRRVALAPAQTARVDFDLEQANARLNATIDSPLARYALLIQENGSAQTGATQSAPFIDGTARFEHLPPGDYVLVARENPWTRALSAQRVRLHEGDQAAVRLTLAPTAPTIDESLMYLDPM